MGYLKTVDLAKRVKLEIASPEHKINARNKIGVDSFVVHCRTVLNGFLFGQITVIVSHSRKVNHAAMASCINHEGASMEHQINAVRLI